MAHQQRSLPVDESLIFVGDFTRTTGYELASEVFDRGADAVFCANDGMARGFYHRAMERGVKVPDKFGLVGFDGTSVDPFDLPSLTSMIQPFDAMADAALEMLIRRVGGDVDVKSRTLDPGSSTGTPLAPYLTVRIWPSGPCQLNQLSSLDEWLIRKRFHAIILQTWSAVEGDRYGRPEVRIHAETDQI